MGKNADYSILYSGLFTEKDLQCTVIPGKRIYSAATKKKINHFWQKRANQSLFNGIVYSLVKSDCQSEKILYWLQKTDYKSFYGTNLQQQFSESANILAVCSVIETNDGFILLGKRSEKLAESSAKWHVIGGSIDSATASEETAFAAMQKEMKEEAGIYNKDIKRILCVGLGINNVIQKPEFLFYTKLKISKQELKRKLLFAQDKSEHTKLTFLAKENVADFVENNPFSIIGKAAVHQYLGFLERR